MAADNFVWFTDSAKGGQLSQAAVKPQGETTDKWFNSLGAFEAKSLSFDVEQADTAGSGTGGAGAGKAKFGRFKIERDVDLASAPMFQACCAGAHFPSVMVASRKAGGEKIVFLQFIFRMVYVTSMSWSGGSGEEGPVESVEFAFGAMGVQYVRQKATGQADTPIQALWSTISNKSTLEVTDLGGAPSFLGPGQS